MKTRYRIVYAITRPEIGEQLSVGLILIDKKGCHFTYSKRKLDTARNLLNKESSCFLVDSIGLLDAKFLSSIEISQIEKKLDYLSRYSNNILRIAPVQEIDVNSSENIPDWLFSTMVDDISMRA